jgi:hypothetical protein
MRLPAISLLALLIVALGSPSQAAPDTFQITSPDFTPGGLIPAQFTADGANIPPTLNMEGVPATAKSLVLIVDDPDAPSGTFTHWLVWNIPPTSKTLGAHSRDGAGLDSTGTNDFGETKYKGPHPPSGTHRYFFKLSALDTTLQLPPGALRKQLEAAMQGHILATATLMGRYSAHSAQ